MLRVIERGFIHSALSIENVLDPARQRRREEEEATIEWSSSVRRWKKDRGGFASVRCCPRVLCGTVTVQEEEEPDEEPLLLLAHNGAVILGPVCYVRAIPYCYLLG